MNISNEAQRKRAIIEDDIVELVLKHFEGFVMHGGTSVWRCYGGNRFSRDMDFYNNLNPKEEHVFQKRFHKVLVDNGYPIREEKYNNKTNILHVIFRGENTTGKLDITFAKADGVAAEYVKVDGTKRIIRALSPAALFVEKMDTYLNKYAIDAHEAQDLYDIIILKDRIGKPTRPMREKVSKFLATIKKRPPRDEKLLGQLLLSGVAPSFDEMMSILQRWLNDVGK